MTGNTLSPQMRRFRLLVARWQTDPPPAPAVRPPARSSLRPGAGEQFKRADRGEPRRGGRAKNGRRDEMDPFRRPRSYPRRRFYLVGVVSSTIPSPSSPVVARLVVSYVIRSVRRFCLLVARRLAPSFRRRPVPRLVHRSVVSSSFRPSSFRFSSRLSSRSSFIGLSLSPFPRHGRAGRFPIR